MLKITHTNALLVVSPVNYRILPNLIDTQAWMTRPLIGGNNLQLCQQVGI